MRCCARDEGRPFGVALRGGGAKPPHAALAEDRRGERCGNGVVRGVRWGSGRRAGANRRGRVVTDLNGTKPEDFILFRDEPGGSPPTGQVVSGMEAT